MERKLVPLPAIAPRVPELLLGEDLSPRRAFSTLDAPRARLGAVLVTENELTDELAPRVCKT